MKDEGLKINEATARKVYHLYFIFYPSSFHLFSWRTWRFNKAHMPINPKDVTWLEEPEIGFWEATFLPANAKGLKTTLGHITQYRPVTQQYPEQRPNLPQHYRGVHRLNRDEQGRVKCVACMLCATACPANCIAIEAAPAPPDWPDRDKYPATFVLDELRCIYCGMCEEACPVDAIELTHIYDLTGETREELLFDREKLLAVYDETKDNPRDPVRTGRLPSSRNWPRWGRRPPSIATTGRPAPQRPALSAHSSRNWRSGHCEGAWALFRDVPDCYAGALLAFCPQPPDEKRPAAGAVCRLTSVSSAGKINGF
jgi:NADH-quinone oxidoreductase subunit I